MGKGPKQKKLPADHLREAIEEGVAAADAGLLVPDKAVREWIDS